MTCFVHEIWISTCIKLQFWQKFLGLILSHAKLYKHKLMFHENIDIQGVGDTFNLRDVGRGGGGGGGGGGGLRAAYHLVSLSKSSINSICCTVLNQTNKIAL